MNDKDKDRYGNRDIGQERQGKLLGSMNIDYNKFDEKDSQGKYVFDCPDVLSIRRKSWYLPEWDGEDVKAVDEQLTIYRELPIVCKAVECPFADICPLVENGLVTRWIGKSCPLEIVDGFRHFAGYVNDLHIKPTDYTDIQMLNDLVRLQILMSRCDKLIRKEAPIETMVAGIDSKTGLEHKARQPNQLLAVQRQLRQDINKIYSMLLASRQAKVDAEAKQKVKTDVSNQMADLLAYAKEMKDPDEEIDRDRMSMLEIDAEPGGGK